MQEKVYYPETIADMPFPVEPIIANMSAGGSNTSTGAQAPNSIKNNGIFRKFVAHETISQSLNTKSKRILDNFQFTKQGAIQIGEYQNGVSGDIRISPIGIISRDSAGNITFSLDGGTGNVVLAGELQSGSIVTGDVLIQGDGAIRLENAQNQTVIDANGIVSTVSFQSDSISSGTVNSTTSSSFVDIPSSSLTTPAFVRDTRVLIFFLNSTYFSHAGAGDYDGTIKTAITVDGSNHTTLNHREVQQSGYNPDNKVMTMSGQYIATLTAGTHILKLQWSLSTVANSPKANSLGFDIGYVVLGS